jgi:hypothetical protein
MRSLARTKQAAGLAVESSSPCKKLGDTLRPLRHEHLCRAPIHQAVSGADCVAQVERDVIRVFSGSDRDTALRIMRVRLCQRLFCDDENFAMAGKFDSSAQSGHARTHNQIVDRET